MSYIRPRRRAVQGGLTLLFLLLPFIRLKGEQLIRLDIPGLTLHLFGLKLPVEDLYLLWLFVFALVFLFILTTMTLGRAWCGWLCPQTALADLGEGLARLLGLKVRPMAIGGSMGRRILLHGLFMLISLLLGAVFVWYFLGPYDYLHRLAAGELRGWPLGTTLTVAGLTYFNLALVRRLACRDFCPYGRMQLALTEPCTFSLSLDPVEAPRCLNCLACVRACPMGIDIRDGFQVQCINCANCLDACRKVMVRLGQPGLIRYHFGHCAKGWRGLISTKLILVATAFAIASFALVFAALTRPEASLTVTRNAVAPGKKSGENRQIVLFTAYLTNKGKAGHQYHLTATLADGHTLTLQGAGEQLNLGPGEKRRLTLAASIEPPISPPGQEATFAIRDETGASKATSKAFVPPATHTRR